MSAIGDLSLRGATAMVQRNRDVYLKTWKTNFLPPLLEPLLYIVALGYGLGRFVEEVDGVSYARFIAPAILCITMMQSAFFETSYGSYVRMYFQKTWDAVTATPLSVEDVVTGELVWAGLKSVINTALMSIVVVALGLVPVLAVPLVLVLAFVTGLVFAAFGMIVSSKIKHIDSIQFSIYLIVMPVMLFSGTYFPLDQMPAAAQAAANVIPFTHAVEISRSAALGRLDSSGLWGALYLLAWAVGLAMLSVSMMRKRIVV
jgi:lipooligosaccharide transport system permease protein